MADEEGSSSSPGIDGQDSSANRNNETNTSEKKTTRASKTKTVAVESSPKAKTHKESSSDYSLSERFSILSKPKVRSEFHIRTG
jgi:hypothetical protein